MHEYSGISEKCMLCCAVCEEVIKATDRKDIILVSHCFYICVT